MNTILSQRATDNDDALYSSLHLRHSLAEATAADDGGKTLDERPLVAFVLQATRVLVNPDNFVAEQTISVQQVLVSYLLQLDNSIAVFDVLPHHLEVKEREKKYFLFTREA